LKTWILHHKLVPQVFGQYTMYQNFKVRLYLVTLDESGPLLAHPDVPNFSMRVHGFVVTTITKLFQGAICCNYRRLFIKSLSPNLSRSNNGTEWNIGSINLRWLRNPKLPSDSPLLLNIRRKYEMKKKENNYFMGD